LQFIGIAITLCGVMVFFSSTALVFKEIVGVIITFTSGIGWALYMVILKYHLKTSREDIIILTSYSMMSGSLMLLGATVMVENIVIPSLNVWFIILWLSIVNTALAFTLWNHALKNLRAYEQTILQNTMLIQITILACLFLSETLTVFKVLGIIIVFTGVLMVQLAPR